MAEDDLKSQARLLDNIAKLKKITRVIARELGKEERIIVSALRAGASALVRTVMETRTPKS